MRQAIPQRGGEVSHYRATAAEHRARGTTHMDQERAAAARSDRAKRSAAARKRFTARLAICRDCEHYNDRIDTGEPMPNPCKLNPDWTVCRWKSRAASENPSSHAGCMWYNQHVKTARAEEGK